MQPLASQTPVTCDAAANNATHCFSVATTKAGQASACAASVVSGKGSQVERGAILVPLHALPLVFIGKHGRHRALRDLKPLIDCLLD